MANKFTYRTLESNPTQFPVDSLTVIEQGDAVFLDTDDVKPASDQADQLSEEANQALFAQKFAGIAHQQSRSGDIEDIRVTTDGVHGVTVTSDTYEKDDFIGIAEAGSGTALENQVFEKVDRPELAIGTAYTRAASATTALDIRLIQRVQVINAVASPANLNNSNVEILGANKTLTCDDLYLQVLDPAGARDLLLPPEAASKGVNFLVFNDADAAEDITVRDDSDSVTILTISQTEGALLVCDGTTWRGLVAPSA